MEGHAELLLDLGRQAVSVRVVEADVERLQPAQHRGADPPGADGADLHPFEVVRAGHGVGDVPAAVDSPLVRGQVVAHEDENQHDHVLGDADAVAVGDLRDGDSAVDRRLEIDMIRADPRRDRELQVGRHGEALRRQVRGPEGL